MKIITKIKNKLKKVEEILTIDEMRILPSGLAFYLLMSLIPMIVLVTLIVSKITFNIDFIDLVAKGIPSNIVMFLKGIVSSVSNYDNFFALTVAYIILAMNGPTSIIIVTNNLYNIKRENYIKMKIKSFIMTTIILFLFMFIIIIPVLGEVILNILKVFIDIDFIINYIPLYKILTFILNIIVIFIGIDIIYVIAPNKKVGIKETYKGAIFTSVSWLIVTKIFSFYVTNIAKYNELYGNFANILVLLLWIYLLSVLFVLGIIINRSNFVIHRPKIFKSKNSIYVEDKDESKKGN